MSKSKGNVIDPDKIIKNYGADTARLFMLFTAPPTQELDWNDSALEGSYRFIKRFVDRSKNVNETNYIPEIDHSKLSKEEKFARKKIYETLKKSVETFDSGKYGFNTLIASCMESMNALNEQTNRDIWTEGYFILTNVLEPIIPHTCWELSDKFFNLINLTPLEIKEEVFIENNTHYVIMINGKKRAEFDIAKTSNKDEVLKFAKSLVTKWLENKTLIKEIVVPNKLVNLVVK